MPVGGQKSVANQKACSRYPCTNRDRLIWKPNLEYAVDVANRVTIVSQNEGRHPLFFFEFLDLPRKLAYLLLERFFLLRGLGCGGRIVVEEGNRANHQRHTQNGLHHPLPA